MVISKPTTQKRYAWLEISRSRPLFLEMSVERERRVDRQGLRDHHLLHEDCVCVWCGWSRMVNKDRNNRGKI